MTNEEEELEMAVCPICGEEFYAEDGVYIENRNELICPDCADDLVVICGDCGKQVLIDDTIFDPEHDRYECCDCYEARMYGD